MYNYVCKKCNFHAESEDKGKVAEARKSHKIRVSRFQPNYDCPMALSEVRKGKDNRSVHVYRRPQIMEG